MVMEPGSRAQQGLKVAVIVMGVLIVVGTTVVVVTIYNRLSGGGERAAPVRAQGPAEITLAVPAGCAVASSAIYNNRLVLQLGPAAGGASEACRQVLVVDLRSWTLQGRVSLTPTP